MTPSELEAYLHEHIPLSAAMGVRVEEAAPGAIALWAPIAPNINHRGTVFGGSAASLATLAAWSLVHTRLAAGGVDARLVIQRGAIDYLKPLEGDFTARCAIADESAWSRFAAALARKGKARIAMTADLHCGGLHAATFTGAFVALAGRD